MKWLPLLLLLSTPAHGAKCVTRCGLQTHAGRCADFQRAETRFLRELAREIPAWTEPRTCSALRGWKVFVHSYTPRDAACVGGGFRLSVLPYCFGGYTHHFSREIEVEDPRWLGEVLPHEIVHVLQIQFGELVGHCDWARRGLSKAVERVTRKKHDVPDYACSPLSAIPVLR